jgi:tripartite-type tricarboxylate transporter receptor subunit TctC
MKITARVLAALAMAAAMAAGPGAMAQSYPAKPVKFILGSVAGGPIDVLLRGLTDKLTQIWGQPVILENRPGANQNLALDAVAHSAADGYTLLTADNSALAYNMFLYSKLPFDPVNDLVAVTRIIQVPFGVIVKGDLPANNLGEFVALMKKDGKKYNYASTGDGSTIHIGWEAFKRSAQYDMTHVPYKGIAPVMQDMLSGSVDATMAVVIAAMPYIKTQKVKVLAIAGTKRTPILPEVPTTAEAGYPDVIVGLYLGLMAPKGTPAAVMARIQEGVKQALADKAFRDRFIEPYAYETIGDTPEQFARFLKDDRAASEKKIRAIGVKIE